MKHGAGALVVAAAVTLVGTADLAPASLPIDDSQAARARNGLEGTVYLWPTRPVCTLYEPCSAPAPGVTLTFARRGSAIGRTKTGTDGSYRILLPAAIYTVASDRPGPDRSTAPFPRRVKVRLGHIDKLDFTIDTGIR